MSDSADPAHRRDSNPRVPSTDGFGIDDGYVDAIGAWRDTTEATRAALRSAMLLDDGAGPTAREPVKVVRVGERVDVDVPADLLLEDGTRLRVQGKLPPDLPIGYHGLYALEDGSITRLIVSPGHCHLPPDLRTWAWAVQLYAMRSSESWGMGDLADLRRLARWSAGELEAGMLLVNPMNAVAPVLPQESSPYSPVSRCHWNPLYLRVEEVPGASEAGADLERLAASGKALNSERRIDRDTVFRLKQEALERIWSKTARGHASRPFDTYREAQGAPLTSFATYCALAEIHGRDWRSWPSVYHRPDAPAVARFADERTDRLDYYCWLQWLVDQQLARVAEALPLMNDLPIGVDPGGADAWAWQDVLASGASVGAPPDLYNSLGQNWGLPPFTPLKLRSAGYEPFIHTIRASLRHARGLRIDHVMGLFRLFWIPEGASPQEGAYVRYPADELLSILAIESQRASAIVVGEDLGTVEPGVRERLGDARVLSYRLMWFEHSPPSQYPELALSAVTTHDLPTIAGLWTGKDLDAQRTAGCEPAVAFVAEIRNRIRTMLGLADDAPVEDVIERAYRALATSPSMVLAVTLEDALAVEERPNMPGQNQWPSWSLALPIPLEAIERSPLARRIATCVTRRKAARPATTAPRR